jgi:hypothetical protein
MLNLCTIRREDYFPAIASGLITTEIKLQTFGEIWLTLVLTDEQKAAWIGAGYAID